MRCRSGSGLRRSTRKGVAVLACAAVFALSPFAHESFAASDRERSLEVLSPVYTVDREYRSMQGPSSVKSVSFPESQPPELLWVTGYRAEMVGPAGSEPVSQEFMCHSNLDFDQRRHSLLFRLPAYHTNRLFTLSQGQQEVRFPEGFGLPFYSDETFKVTTQVLNLNPDGQRHEVRHRVSIDYVPDRELDQPMQPLFMTSGWGLKLLEGDTGHYGVESPSKKEHGEGCLPGAAAGPDLYEDGLGRRFSGHWVVKPGREVNRTLVTRLMKLPYDTTVHYIAAHLHPFAESLELRDITAGRTVYRSEADGFEDKIGLKRVDYFSSGEGVPIFKEHEYQLISTYNNTTSEDQDSMAVLLLYLRDKKFKRGRRPLIEPAVRTHIELPTPLSPERLTLRTNRGSIEIALYPDAAPQHTEQILRLARLEVYDGMTFYKVVPEFMMQTSFPHKRTGRPLTSEQKSAIRPLRAEHTNVPFRKGTVGMSLHNDQDPHSAEAAFFIMLDDARYLKGKFTAVGEVTGGLDTLERIGRAPLGEAYAPLQKVIIEEVEVTAPSGS